MTNDDVLKCAFEDMKNFYLQQGLNHIKLNNLFELFTSIPSDNKPSQRVQEAAHVIQNPDGTFTLKIVDDFKPVQNRQALGELIIVAGISLFEMSCKDWFSWGLKYYPEKLKIFGGKTITILELIESENPMHIALEKIVDDIKFIDLEECNKKFKDIFEIEIFSSRQHRYDFQKFIEHRHIISHNCGIADSDFVEKTGRDKTDIGSTPFLKKEDLHYFLLLLYEIRERIVSLMITKIVGEIKKSLTKS